MKIPIADSIRTLRNAASSVPLAPLVLSPFIANQSTLGASFETYAREGYSASELVFACIKARATSASEPRMRSRTGTNWQTESPVLQLLRRPNSFLGGVEFWQTVITYLDLDGNAFAWKGRSASTKVLELWLMRPDRVKVIPGRTRFVDRYEYDLGDGNVMRMPPEDVIHWKAAVDPMNVYRGMSPLRAAAARVDVDNYMRSFVKAFFTNAGVPAGLLSVKQPLNAEFREEIKRRFRDSYGGPAGWHQMLVLDNADATFTPLTQTLGAGGLVLPEMNKLDASRICMVFEIPPALIGADEAPTSYAALEMIQQFFWRNTLAPLYKALADVLNRSLLPDFPGVDEVQFDLTDIRAMAEDVDKLHLRVRNDVMGGIRTIEEGRSALGLPVVPADGTFLVPANMVPVPAADVKAGRVHELVKGQPQDATSSDNPPELPEGTSAPTTAPAGG